MTKLEADLKANGEELSKFKSEREKVLYDLTEMQVTIAEKDKKLIAANNSIEDLTLKLATLSKTLDDLRTRERTLTTELQNQKGLVEEATFAHGEYKKGVEIWTEKLVDVALKLQAELINMGLHNYAFSADPGTADSVKITMFLDGVVDALWQIDQYHRFKLANESRQLC
jgi:chromosome segregation ATPase